VNPELKKNQKWRNYAFKLLLGAGVLVAAIFIGGLIISKVLKDKIASELSKGNGSVASVRVNLFTRSVSLYQLVIATESSNLPLRGNIDRLQLSGVNIYQLLAGKGIKIKNILLDSGVITYDFTKTDSTKKTPPSYAISVEDITLNKIHFSIKQDSILELKAVANVSFGSIHYDSAFSFEDLGATFHYLTGSFNQLNFSEATGFYKMSIDKIEFNSKASSLFIDSLKLIPTYDKVEFGQAKGKQVSRVDLSIKSISFSQFDYKSLFDKALLVSRLSIVGSRLHAFRDKRLPFIKKEVVPMPMYAFLKLPFKIKIDSIDIQQANIVVEEIAADAIASGHVIFNNVKGLLTGLSNQSQEPALLNATGNFMKTGLIDATFTFPADSTQEYTAKGKISNVPFHELNTITTPAASLEFESGLLNNLYFNFAYNDYKSLGEIQINYKDLKILSLNEAKSVQKVKSALINALIKDTKDKKTPVKDRKGKIEIERDRKRFIFNLWWKSIQAGLKDSILGSGKK
jgi:hypothetical protein